MKAPTALLLAILLLAGCAAPVPTEPPVVTTQPTTVPPETTLPLETTAPMETTVPVAPEEEAVKAVVDAFLTAYEENIYLYTDNEWDHLTVLFADPAATVTHQGEAVALSEFHQNIQTRHEKEADWKHSRQEQGIYRHNFVSECHVQSITFDGDTVTVMAEYAMSFTYDDQPGTTSGGRDEFELLLVQVDGAWLIADVTEIGG